MGLFDNAKKKKIIDKINSVKNYEKYDYAFFKDYDYKTLLELEEKDYYLTSDQLKELLDVIVLVGHKLKNVDIFSTNFVWSLKGFINSKEDYLYLDTLCSKYDIDLVREYVSKREINTIRDIMISDIDKYVNEKKEYEQVALLFNEKRIDKPEYINIYEEAQTYIKIMSFMNENSISIDMLNKESFKDFNQLFTKIDLNLLSEQDKNNLVDYIYSKESTINIDIKSLEELKKYSEIRKKAFDKVSPLNISSSLIISYVTSFKYTNILFNTMINSRDIYKIFDKYTDDELKTIYSFTDEELSLLRIFISIDKAEDKNENEKVDFLNIFNNLKGNVTFNNYDFSNLITKVDNVYKKECSKALTSLDNDNVKYMGTEQYGVSLYIQEDGEFSFLSHSTPKHYFSDLESWERNGKWHDFLSTSIVSDNGVWTYNNGVKHEALFMCFNNIDSNQIVGIGSGHLGSGDSKIVDKDGLNFRKDMRLPDELVDSFNEVAIKRKCSDGTIVKPDFITCYDKVDEVSINVANYYKIPVLLIKTEKYLKRFESQIKEVNEKIKKVDKTKLGEYYKLLDKLHTLLIKRDYLINTGYSKSDSNNWDRNFIKEIENELSSIAESIETEKNKRIFELMQKSKENEIEESVSMSI